MVSISVERIGLIIAPNAHMSIGENVQGPSVIRAPSWVENPLGRYLMYFADHKGDHIRLAYSDDIAGPWSIVPGGCLNLDDSHFLTDPPPSSPTDVQAIRELYDRLYDTYEVLDFEADLVAPHIASPDVRVNEADQVIEMWFHGLADVGIQMTRYAASDDGRRFVAEKPTFDGVYLRTFAVRDEEFGVVMPGQFVRRTGGPTEFETGPRFLPGRARHMAVWVVADELRVFYTMVGDTPERILMQRVDVGSSWPNWTLIDEPVEILRPATSWEGADEPLVPSMRSFWRGPANQLRDPYVFIDEDGSAYLFYAAAGEHGIGAARLHVDE